MLCFVEYILDGWRAISTWPRLEPHLFHVAISTDKGYTEGCLYLTSDDEFQRSSFISTDFIWKQRYFAKVHMQEF